MKAIGKALGRIGLTLCVVLVMDILLVFILAGAMVTRGELGWSAMAWGTGTLLLVVSLLLLGHQIGDALLATPADATRVVGLMADLVNTRGEDEEDGG